MTEELKRARRFNRNDKLFAGGLSMLSLTLLALVIATLISLLWGSMDSFKEFGLNFFTGFDAADGSAVYWNPTEDEEQFSMLPALIGTLKSSFLALLISAPFSLAIALFLGEYFPKGKVSTFFTSLVELLAGIPSVIYGFWALNFLVPDTSIGMGMGYSTFTAAIVLSIMIIPYSASLAREIITMTPKGMKESAYAMGATRFEVIKDVVVPYCRGGITAGFILSLGRALGETMAVMMVIGNVVNTIPADIFQPGTTMASVIANAYAEADTEILQSALVQIGLILFVVTGIINIIGKVVIRKMDINNHNAFSGNTLSSRLISILKKPVEKIAERVSYFRSTSFRYLKNNAFRFGVIILSVLAVIPLFMIFGFIFHKGISALNLDLFIKEQPGPGEAGGGVFNAIQGTFILISIASLIAIPIGVLVGTWMAEYRKSKLAFFISVSVEVLQGIPSIVLGILVSLWIVGPQQHFSALSGAVALSIMMIPIIARSTEETLKMLPQSLKEASLALGVPYYATILKVVLPAGISGIITGILLSLARITGETAPLILTSFGNDFINWNINEPVAALPHVIYKFAIAPYESWNTLAWGAAVILLASVLFLNLMARMISTRWKWY